MDWGGGGGRRQSREEEWSEEQVRPPWFGKSVPLLLSKVLEQPSENLTVMCRLTGRSESSADILIRTRSSPLTWSTWYIFLSRKNWELFGCDVELTMRCSLLINCQHVSCSCTNFNLVCIEDQVCSEVNTSLSVPGAVFGYQH